MLFTLLLFVASVVLSELLRPKPKNENQRLAGLGDFSFPTATEDRIVPIPFGKVLIKGPNVVWYGDLSQTAITEKVKTGLFSSARITKGFRYNLGVQMALCRGVTAVTLKRIRIGEKDVWTGTKSVDGDRIDIDAPDLHGGDEYGSGGVRSSVDFYTGTTTQAVNAYLNDTSRQKVAAATTPTAPRYTGTSYIVARELTSAGPATTDIGAYLGNSTQIKKWSFEIERFPAIFSGQSAGDQKIGTDDCNLVNVIYEILTNKEYQINTAVADINLTSFKAAADVMITEANGFSMLLDRPDRASELLGELQRQMGGVLFRDTSTGKWTITLTRDDFDIDTIQQLTVDNCTLDNFTRGAWKDTTNQIQVSFIKRADDYKPSNALSQDSANAMIQGGGTIGSAKVVSGQSRYPGCMTGALANYLAARDLRAQTYPLAKAKVTVNRELWALNIGDPVALTHTGLGLAKTAFRVTRIGIGRLQDGKVQLDLIQSVFKFAAANFADTPDTNWTDPVVSLVAFPSAQQLAIEAPRGLMTRDPVYNNDDEAAKVFVSARRQGLEVGYQIGQRNASGTPGGSYAEDGDVTQFMYMGDIKAALAIGTATPTTTITLDSTPDTQANIEAAFNDAATLVDIGTNLVHLIYVGGEFMLVSTAANGTGTDVDLGNVYRGALDSVQTAHAAGADVYLVFVGAGMAETAFDNAYNVDIELRPKSSVSTFAGSVTAINLTMDKRGIRPYPPSAPLYNNTATRYGTPDGEGDGSGGNGLGFDVEWLRRRLTASDEVVEMLTDQTGVDASTEYRVRVFVDPSGGNTEVFTGSWATGTGPIFVNRLLLWEIAAASTEIRVQIETRHDIHSETNLESRVPLVHDVTPTSLRDGDFYLGGNLSASTPTNTYAAAASGTYVVNIGAAYSTSAVEYKLNAGAWTSVIAATGTTGNIVGVTATDTIALRHTVNETPDPQYVELVNPSAAVVAYGTFSA